MSDRDRHMARDLVGIMVGGMNPPPGLVMLAIINENERGELELGIALDGGTCLTERGAVMLKKLGDRLREGVVDLVAEFSVEVGAEVRERPDLSIDVAGERPKA